MHNPAQDRASFQTSVTHSLSQFFSPVACLREPFIVLHAFVFILIGLGLASALFYYGMNVPFEYRLRGDAWSYINLAHQFTSFGQALHYVGPRTLGFPLFEYLFIYWDSSSTFVSRVDHICLTLFILHQLTSLWVCFMCIKCNVFKRSSIYLGVLFVVLAAYPVTVMHTTTPLSDVLGMDVLFIGFSLFAFVNDGVLSYPSKRQAQLSLCLGLLSGCILAYAILVRPAYWPGVVGFLTAYVLVIVANQIILPGAKRLRSLLMWLFTIIALISIIMCVMDRCKARNHTLCLQDPQTFLALDSVKIGLSSARTVWHYNSGPEGIPFYPDAFLLKHFYHRCPLTSVIGTLNSDNSNLLSCMYHAPGLSVIYFFKKVTGLFDPFRMTPYTELITPVWYIWLARFFSSIAFVGFWILLWEGGKSAYQFAVYRKPVSAFMAAAWSFCVIQVLVHSVLHIEERYALPWIPFCIIAIFLKIKAQKDSFQPIGISIIWFILMLMMMLGYFFQVLLWDDGMKLF